MSADKRGERLLPHVIEDLASSHSLQAWASIAAPGTLDWRDHTYHDLANAVNRMAWWARATLGAPPPPKQPTVAYLGPSDLRYYVLVAALCKAGFAMLSPSHLNTEARNMHLFKATECTTLLYGFQDTSKIAVDLAGISVHQVPGLDVTWDPTPAERFPFDKAFAENKHERAFILHTSGSTGFPKPIIYTHDTLAALDTLNTFPSWNGISTDESIRHSASRPVLGFPLFHGSGLLIGISTTILTPRPAVFPPPDRPMNAAMVATMLGRAHVDAASLLPSVLEELAARPDAAALLAQLRFVSWGGGQISAPTGDFVARHTRLLNMYASTETAWARTLVKAEAADWEYSFFDPEANGFEFRPVEGSALFELFIVPDARATGQVFRLSPGIKEWATKDLFEKHPVKEHHWRVVARADDLVVLSWGNKVAPAPLEGAACRAPGVAGAVVGGTARARVCLLVEPRDFDEVEQMGARAFVDKVWPFVEDELRVIGEHSCLTKGLVVMVTADKRLPRTGKMTVQRGAALKLYEKEIQAAYAKEESCGGAPELRIGAADRS